MAKQRRKPVNYLTKKELLLEIHKSKCSYSEFDDPKYQDYDLIIEDIKKLTQKKTIIEAQKNRVKKLIDELTIQLEDEGKTSKEIEEIIKLQIPKPSKIDKKDLVIRVMTKDHIPDIRAKSNKIIKAPTNFPPFQHYALIKNKWKCVGKSHCKNGKFCTNHGNLTNKLAMALMKLVDKFGSHWKYRNYTYIEDMKGSALVRLCQTSLQFNEAKGSEPFSYYTEIAYHCFISMLNAEKNIGKLKGELIQEAGFDQSFGDQASGDLANAQRDYYD